MSASGSSLHRKSEVYARKQHRTNTILKSHPSTSRLIVSRTLKHISAQIVSKEGHSVAQVIDIKMTGTKSEKAFMVGKKIASLAQEKNITAVAFDRNGFLYHGRVAKLAEGAREAGLQF